jgi:DNA-binding GntR family transcriptional regulator
MSRDLLEHRIYDYLRASLGTPTLTVGSHVNAGEIASGLEVSRTTVRKAILRLSEDGCVALNDAGRPIVVSVPKGRRRRKPVFEYTNHTERAYWWVFDAFLKGQLPEGTSVNGQELSAAVGVSLGTMRQALDWLCRDGMLRRMPRRGWRVIHLDDDDVADAFAIRTLLELECLERAVERVDQRRFELLIDENDRVARGLDNLGHHERRRMDYRFHRTLLEAAGSPILLDTVDPLIRKCLLIAAPPTPSVRVSYGEHVAIARALLDRDVPRAQAVLREHLGRMSRARGDGTGARPRRAPTAPDTGDVA